MTMKDLYIRIKDATGLEVLTVSDMYSLYKNCAADLSGRGYREFTEVEITDFTDHGKGKISFEGPSNLKKTLYFKVMTDSGLLKCSRVSVTDDRIDAVYTNGETRYKFVGDNQISEIYYTKGKKYYSENKNNKKVSKIVLGYYKKVDTDIIPESYTYTDENGEEITSTDINDQRVLETIKLPIREELQDAFVFYGMYYSYNKRLKESEMITRHLNNYKYSVEDLLYQLEHEDNFNQEDSVIVVDSAEY